MHHISKRNCRCLWGILQKKLFDDNEQDDSEQELGEDGNQSSTDVHHNNTDEMTRIPEITTEELQVAINKLKKRKSPDSKGIRAEDIKACDDETKEMVRQIFNEIIKRNEFTLEDWKKVTIKVIHKKGDVESVSNYRPDLFIACVVQIVLDREPSAGPETSGRSGWLQKILPSNRSSCDVLND